MISSSLNVNDPTSMDLPISKSSKYHFNCDIGELRVMNDWSGYFPETGLCDKPCQMIIGIAQRRFDHRQPLEMMGRRQLVGDAHAAVQLHRLLAHILECLPDTRLRSRNRAAPFVRIG